MSHDDTRSADASRDASAEAGSDVAGADGYAIRTATADDFPAIYRMVNGVFGWEIDDTDLFEIERLRFEPDRDHVITWRDGGIVGNIGAFSAELTVPGASLPVALVTGVGIEADHRRQGLLRRLIAHQFREIRETWREPVAMLWASEGSIYQRFGYGMATLNLPMSIDSRGVRLRSDACGTGRVRTLPAASVRAELERLYARVLPDRPGWFTRNERWWNARFIDPKHFREGTTSMRVTVHRQDDADNGAIDGYVLWRMEPWGAQSATPNGAVRVVELLAATPEAYRALWHFLLTMDLTNKVTVSISGVDDPLLYLVGEPRALNGTLADGLWLRIVDLPAALTGRRYAAPVDVVLGVTDAMVPQNSGTWRLRAVGDGAATCERVSGVEPDITCDIADLGALYLGGMRLGPLVAAGRVTELRPGAAGQVSAAFGWHVTPTAFELF